MSDERTPPNALDIERSVLGSMICEPRMVDEVMGNVVADDFYNTSHKKIFATISVMYQSDEQIDILTLSERLRGGKILDMVGGDEYLSDIAGLVATTTKAETIQQWVKIISGHSSLRKLIVATDGIQHIAFQADGDPQKIMDDAEAKIFAIASSRSKKGLVKVGIELPNSFAEIEAYTGGGVSGIPTGFSCLDEMLGGMASGDLIVVAGRPSMGKTALAMGIATHVAIQEKKSVGIFSLEMTTSMLVQRMICSEARVSPHQVRTGNLRKSDFQRLSGAAGPLSVAPIWIDDTPEITAMEIRAKARRHKATHGLDLVIIDYLQLMGASGRFESRRQEIDHISRALQSMAKELDLPVIAISQLSRAVEQRGGDKRPQLSDLRESGAIEQDADVVAFVFREEYYKRDDPGLSGVAEVIVAKQRNGPTGTVKLTFLKHCIRFENQTKDRDDNSGYWTG